MAGRPQLAQVRVLLVDDNATYRQTVRRILSTAAGIEVVGEAADGRDCLTQASELNPDVILLDCSMPGMDGPEAARLLHAIRPDVRVIALSVGDDEDCMREMERAGVAEVFLKSVGPDELSRAILASQ